MGDKNYNPLLQRYNLYFWMMTLDQLLINVVYHINLLSINPFFDGN